MMAFTNQLLRRQIHAINKWKKLYHNGSMETKLSCFFDNGFKSQFNGLSYSKIRSIYAHRADLTSNKNALKYAPAHYSNSPCYINRNIIRIQNKEMNVVQESSSFDNYHHFEFSLSKYSDVYNTFTFDQGPICLNANVYNEKYININSSKIIKDKKLLQKPKDEPSIILKNAYNKLKTDYLKMNNNELYSTNKFKHINQFTTNITSQYLSIRSIATSATTKYCFSYHYPLSRGKQVHTISQISKKILPCYYELCHYPGSHRIENSKYFTRTYNSASVTPDSTLGSTITAILDNLTEPLVLDMTFGDGHHTRSVLDRIPNSRVISLDRDEGSHKIGISMRKEYQNRLIPLHGKISYLNDLLSKLDNETALLGCFDAVIIDPGVSSKQKEDIQRGFNFNTEAPLDMRMDKDGEVMIYDVLKHIDETDLRRILKYYGGELQARKIAAAIIEARYELKPMLTTSHLNSIIKKLFGKSYSTACVYQALRMFVNNELNELNYGIDLAYHYLKPDGKLIAISHNPQEDNIITEHILAKDLVPKEDKFGIQKEVASPVEQFSSEEMENVIPKKWRTQSSMPLIPSLEEQEINPDLRMVRIRTAQKLCI